MINKTVKPYLLRFLVLLLSYVLLLPVAMSKGKLTVHVGPASLGDGGSNPISLPPFNPLEWEAVWLNDKKREWSLSITPGVFYGYRHSWSLGTYVSLGGGWVISSNGTGPGVYSAFGYNYCRKFCVNIEYKQAVGIYQHLLSPFAVRVGIIITP